MPHVLILDFPGGGPAQYDQVTERMGLHGVLPEDALAHVAAPTDAGLRVCDVWTSPEAFDRFAAAQIMPLAAEAGLPQPEIRRFPAHRWHREHDGRPTFAQVVRLPGIDLAAFDGYDVRIRPDGRWPDGLIWHAAGALDGDVYVVDAWTDKAKRDVFGEERIGPVMADATLAGPPSFDELTVHGSMEPAGAPAAG
jgi:hypothetical protein